MSDTWKGNDYQAVYWGECPDSDLIDEILQEFVDEGVIIVDPPRTTMGLNATDPMGLNSTTDMGLR